MALVNAIRALVALVGRMSQLQREDRSLLIESDHCVGIESAGTGCGAQQSVLCDSCPAAWCVGCHKKYYGRLGGTTGASSSDDGEDGGAAGGGGGAGAAGNVVPPFVPTVDAVFFSPLCSHAKVRELDQ